MPAVPRKLSSTVIVGDEMVVLLMLSYGQREEVSKKFPLNIEKSPLNMNYPCSFCSRLVSVEIYLLLNAKAKRQATVCG